jgi:hypothetical protein
MATRALPRINQDAVDQFTCGQCHALALAIHEKTGLPLAGIWRHDYNPEHSTPCHVVVQHPKGTLIDIQGPGAEDRWEGIVQSMDVEVVRDLSNRDYSTPRMDEAEPYANAVLKTYNIQPFKVSKRRKA